MRIRVDKETDALYFRFDEAQIVESEEVEPGVILDYNADEQVVGIVILGISAIKVDPEAWDTAKSFLKNIPQSSPVLPPPTTFGFLPALF